MNQHLRTLFTGCGLFASVVIGGVGCKSSAGGSFSRRIDDTVWSFERVFDQRGDLESLPGNLKFFIFEPEYRVSPIQQEWGELGDTFSLLGW